SLLRNWHLCNKNSTPRCEGAEDVRQGAGMPMRSSGRTDPIPKNYEGIVNLITRDYADLSAGFQQIARFFTQNPNVVALESINAVAAKCGAHPSSLVRFAQNFGYSG